MPGDSSSSDPHPQGTVELFRVTAGELTLTVDGTKFHVPAGSSASFEASTPHTYSNDSDTLTTMVMATPSRPRAEYQPLGDSLGLTDRALVTSQSASQVTTRLLHQSRSPTQSALPAPTKGFGSSK